ncbi:MAG TPA: sulfotransferase [Phycisphaerales bacterium]|nr:sulfotransferase [Phycisphaerales bacterium]
MPTPAELTQQARRLHAKGQMQSAIDLFQAAIKAQPRNADAHQGLGLAFYQVGRLPEALDHLERSVKLDPMSGHRLFVLATVMRNLGMLREARDAFQKAVWLNRDLDGAVAGLAQIMGAMGEHEQALALVAPAASKGGANTEAVAVHAELCLFLGRPEQGIGPALGHLERPGLHPLERQRLLFQVGRLYEASGEYDRAFEAFSSANQLHAVRWDHAAFRAMVDRAIADWSPEAYAHVATCPSHSDRPVFIVGIPRSGAALVEQIIAGHPRCSAGGPLSITQHILARLHETQTTSVLPLPHPSRVEANDVTQAAAFYLRALKSVDPSADRVTDRMPMNFLYLPLIARMFPAAHVLRCRRDAMDTCLSCWTHDFSGPLHFAYDFDSLAAFYADHERLMRHWTEALGVQALDVQYERLVAEQEPQTRRIVEGIGVEWDAACLRFHENPRLEPSMEQVRRPLHASSVSRHARYGPRLEPLRQALRREGVELG